VDEFKLVSTEELNQIEGGGMLTAGTFTAKLPPHHGGFGGGGSGANGGGEGDGSAAGGGGGRGFIWGDGDPKLPD
jgi:bacteriocin-like protein